MQIVLFPINIVLFPESILPLHIFEEKYKRLINNSVKSKSAFGVSLEDGNKIADIGCLAVVESIVNKYPDGRLDINILGCLKYKIVDYPESKSDYVIAEVEIVKDKKERINQTLLSECIDIYNFMTADLPTLRLKSITKDDLKDRLASYFFAQKAGLILKQKQVLLEMSSENERLEFVKNHLLDMEPSVDKTTKIERIIRNDGYLKRGGTK